MYDNTAGANVIVNLMYWPACRPVMMHERVDVKYIRIVHAR